MLGTDHFMENGKNSIGFDVHPGIGDKGFSPSVCVKYRHLDVPHPFSFAVYLLEGVCFAESRLQTKLHLPPVSDPVPGPRDAFEVDVESVIADILAKEHPLGGFWFLNEAERKKDENAEPAVHVFHPTHEALHNIKAENASISGESRATRKDRP